MMSTTLPRFKLTNHISAWRGGQGMQLVLVHGVGLSADAWYAMLPELTKHFTVTAVDMPGHGESDVLQTASQAALADYTTAIANAIEEMDGSIVIVGHSMGALIAMDLAIVHHEKISAAIALNPIFRRSVDAAKAVRVRASELSKGKIFDNKSTLERWFGASSIGPMKEAYERCDGMLNSANHSGYAAAYNVFAHEDGPSDEALKSCEVPMLFMTGANEPNSTPKMSMQLAAMAVNGRSKIIGDARHMMPITHAQQVSQNIIKFVQKELGYYG